MRKVFKSIYCILGLVSVCCGACALKSLGSYNSIVNKRNLDTFNSVDIDVDMGSCNSIVSERNLEDFGSVDIDSDIVNCNPVVNERNIEAFNSVDIDIDSSKINFIVSDSYGIEISMSKGCDVPKWTVEDGTLRVRGDKILKRCNTDDNILNIYYPKEQFENISILSNAGKISIPDMTAKKLDIDLKTGIINMNIDKDRCEKLKLNICSGKVSIKGDVSKSTSVECKNGTINFSGNLNGESDFKLQNGTIKIKCKGHESDYNYDLSLNSGNIKLKNKYVGNQVQKISSSGSNNHISASTQNGIISLDFKK